MVIKELYLEIKSELTKAGLESPAFEALMIMEKVLNFKGREFIVLHSDDTVEDSNIKKTLKMAQMRKYSPLQYVLGEWQFMDMTLSVGEGVLVPREDTEALVRAASDFIGSRELKVLDLCAGSGAVSLGIASLCKNVDITCLEISKDAFLYLEANIKKYFHNRIFPVKGDVFTPELPDQKFDVIVSNPPYIPSDDILKLQWETRKEPVIALDGGSDGLSFYRAISEKWKPFLSKGGMLAVEIGIGQELSVAEIFMNSGFDDIEIFNDINEIPRVVKGLLHT